jgi:hypothetical protein
MRHATHEGSTPSRSMPLLSLLLHFKEPPWEEKVDYGLGKIVNNQEFSCEERRQISLFSDFRSVYDMRLSCFWYACCATGCGSRGDALNLCYPQNARPLGSVILCASNTLKALP